MKRFSGFPARGNFTPLPNIFFSALLPEINDPIELKITLLLFEIIYPKKGYPKYAAFTELLNDTTVRACLPVESAESKLKAVLDDAIVRGSFIRLSLEGERPEDLYFQNNEENRQAVEKIRDGQLQIEGVQVKAFAPTSPVKEPDIFTYYEENIGMLTPIIADGLKDAEKNYPEKWVRDAIKEAADLNKRNWRYISRILERWSTEGKKDGTYQRNIKENTDPDKYIKGKYGHIVQR